MARAVSPDLYDPDGYVDGPPHALFEELRRTEPVHWQDMPGGDGYWAVLRHRDVVEVARQTGLFSASLGGVVLEDLEPDQLEMMRNMLLAMDPPRHQDYRRPLVPRFKARVIAGLEGRIRAICREILDRVGPRAEVELVHDVASRLPSQVIGELVGIPRRDWPWLHEKAEQSTSSQDPDVTGGREGADAPTPSVEMALYAIQHAASRRAAPPRDDLTSLLLSGEFGGRPMTDVDFGSFFVQLVTAGNDTTKTMLSSGVLALVEHPQSLAELRSDPGSIPAAVEEVLRWANPVHYFRRTATADTVLGGARIRKGEKVAMYYTSANRDGDVFDDPHRFDIRRQPNPHLSFGIAEHFCLGVHLARLEGKVFFDELLSAYRTIELAGVARRTRSNLNNSLRSLPVRLAA